MIVLDAASVEIIIFDFERENVFIVSRQNSKIQKKKQLQHNNSFQINPLYSRLSK